MKPFVTRTRPIRYTAFERPKRIVISRQGRDGEPEQGMDVIVYADLRQNTHWRGVKDDGVYVSVCARRVRPDPSCRRAAAFEWEWLVDASASRPDEPREQTRKHTKCESFDAALVVVHSEIERLTRWIESKGGTKPKSS